jgi:hypothetical protein
VGKFLLGVSSILILELEISFYGKMLRRMRRRIGLQR